MSYTIEVCPDCGAMEGDEPTGCHYCEVEGGRLTPIEVFTATEIHLHGRSILEEMGDLDGDPLSSETN